MVAQCTVGVRRRRVSASDSTAVAKGSTYIPPCVSRLRSLSASPAVCCSRGSFFKTTCRHIQPRVCLSLIETTHHSTASGDRGAPPNTPERGQGVKDLHPKTRHPHPKPSTLHIFWVMPNWRACRGTHGKKEGRHGSTLSRTNNT